MTITFTPDAPPTKRKLSDRKMWRNLARSTQKRNEDYVNSFYTERSLQWNLGPEASIPYSLAHVPGNGWLIGDEGGKIWFHDGIHLAREIEELLEFPDGISEISVLNRENILIGDMRGQVTIFDLNYLTEDTIRRINTIQHRSPIKCIRWQPNQSSCFASAGQDGNVLFADIRTSNTNTTQPTVALLAPHSSDVKIGGTHRTTMTGLVFHPLRTDLFFTSGTPDTTVRLWDTRKLSQNVASFETPKKGRAKSKLKHLKAEEEFLSNHYNSFKHRSSVALTIDSTGSRIFLATSNNNIFEFLTCNPDFGPVASYSAPNYTSCSFFSNITVDPTDRFLLSGSTNGQAYIWDTTHSTSKAYQLPVSAQLEVSKTCWSNGPGGCLDAQIACISDDLTFSLFNWCPDSNNDMDSRSRRRPSIVTSHGKESLLYDENLSGLKEKENVFTFQNPVSGSSMPSTPVKRNNSTSINSNININTSSTTPFRSPLPNPPSSVNKSILDFFPKTSPRVT